MAYNKQYNTRARYNTPGQFVSAGELAGGEDLSQPYTPQQKNFKTFPNTQPTAISYQIPTTPRNPPQNQNLQPIQEVFSQTSDVEMKIETDDMLSKKDDPSRPAWMKTKLPGIKKISNKERRRRQNAHLRRLLTPKNAVMVLNEMMPNEHVTSQYKVEPAPVSYYQQPNVSFCADLTLQGSTYKGYGENKMVARNHAAEQAVRDLVLKKMTKMVNSDGESSSGEGPDEEVLPMIQLASFALYKLFTEWEYEGHKVPQLRPATANSTSEAMEGGEEEGAQGAAIGTIGGGGGGGGGGAPKAPKAKGPRVLPANAAAMHPCMLLTYMRANLDYREVSAMGDRAQNMLYTASVDVDGHTYMGTGPNKKEARKNAAKAACEELFGVQFDPKPTSNVPVPALLQSCQITPFCLNKVTNMIGATPGVQSPRSSTIILTPSD
ncbi:hypothetical protein K1T71_007542 [Dendrolimus kikuchii]|uniref:Uncharacterized protein n=1 Tax=Dendrolimus kikuchii TaxID=765133 RepID=A0ACC1CXI8_9NEOP|nr:hypothetical protein K1T71_007542 [Dendrolimus kikuchii]